MRINFPAQALALVLFAAAMPSQGASFTYQTIDDPAGGIRIFGINDNGDVSGDHNGSSIFSYSNGVFTTYSLSDGAGVTTYDTRINNAGELVGTDSSLHAFKLVNGVATEILVPNATLSFGSGINNTGMIVGGYYTDSDPAGGFKLQNGEFTRVFAPGSYYTNILGVNDAGDVAGSYSDGVGAHGYVERDGVYSTIDAPDSSNDSLWGINSSGNVVGDASSSTLCPPGQSACGFFFDGSTFTAIVVPGSVFTMVQAMNNLNQIAGYYVTSDNVGHGFIASPDTSAPEPGTFVLMAGCACLGLAGRRFRSVLRR